jgi:hypothetical protein
MIMAEILAGGFNVHNEVGEKEMAIFNAAMKNHCGVDYTPVAVASQLVNGTNYIFICVGKPVVAHPIPALYAVKIYTRFAPSVAPNVEIKDIKEIDVATLD